ncbi:uncharacterized protein LOC133201093 [Saccostrea echinata]|uniref:uncharacterized protein LOC133201093 n=1 Tax=Saccostrea echinata TaxID=191078 RepID=UPI002A83845E|nr:uncharacterized protein LOC133201093 [Saccostrea echinata]
MANCDDFSEKICDRYRLQKYGDVLKLKHPLQGTKGKCHEDLHLLCWTNKSVLSKYEDVFNDLGQKLDDELFRRRYQNTTVDIYVKEAHIEIMYGDIKNNIFLRNRFVAKLDAYKKFSLTLQPKFDPIQEIVEEAGLRLICLYMCVICIPLILIGSNRR